MRGTAGLIFYHGGVNAEIASIHVYHGGVNDGVDGFHAGADCVHATVARFHTAFDWFWTTPVTMCFYHGAVNAEIASTHVYHGGIRSNII